MNFLETYLNYLNEQIHQPIGKGYEKNVVKSDKFGWRPREIQSLKAKPSDRVTAKLYARKRGKARAIRNYTVRASRKPKYTARTHKTISSNVPEKFKKKYDYGSLQRS